MGKCSTGLFPSDPVSQSSGLVPLDPVGHCFGLVPSDPEAVIVHPVPMRASPETLKKDGDTVYLLILYHKVPYLKGKAGIEFGGTVTGLLIPVQASSQADGMGQEEPPAPPPRPPQQHGRSLSVDLQ
ncbi:hypothetical protein AM593_04958, partial [Mytilus galloprovincialis]